MSNTAPDDAMRTLVVHGHFYQPPREDPRTGEVPVEAGAAPWHDYNAKIAAECYHPNLVARVVDGSGRVVDMVDNYARMSFNIGPTLLAWLESHASDTYARICTTGSTTHNAIAQGFNHSILPLCNDRDLRTQVRWGLADFRFRFGYRAEGMWLPETGVDDRVLAVLAEEGVQFTILAPRQAVSVRVEGQTDWQAVDEESLDTSILYRWSHPEDPRRTVTVLFYDGPLSNEIAFGIGGLSSEAFINQVAVRARATNRAGRLLAVATDGETFGHHHHFADRTLGFALSRIAQQHGLEVRSAAEVVRTHPADASVRIRESAWSCAHGLGRWTTDCGCATGGGPGWHQRWRAPLRTALDLLRDIAAATYERRGRLVMRDPWAARDAAVDVFIGARSFGDFAAEELLAPDDGESVRVATELLESQRLAMAMFTSCGWFFNDIAGIEARIVLRFAAGLVVSLQRIDEALPIERFVEILGSAEGNQALNGADVWRSVLAEVADRSGDVDRGDVDRRDVDRRDFAALDWAPIVSDHDRAQEAVFEALRVGSALDASALAVVGGALGLRVPPSPNSPLQ